MTALVFTLAIVVALAVTILRHIRRRGVANAWRRVPGHSREAPAKITRFDDIEALLRRDACLCGGRLVAVSEGSVAGDASVRVVVAECARCEEQARLYFEQTQILH